MELSSGLIALLKCPVSGGSLEYDRVNKLLISRKAGLAYPIVDGIPLLLESEALEIPPKEK